MKYGVNVTGVCARRIIFKIDDDGYFHDLEISGGCRGYSNGLASLCEGLRADFVAERLSGVVCGDKGTSCADKLASAIKEALKMREKKQYV